MSPQPSATLTRPDYKERILFLGENGCGKSTLARALLSSGYRYVVIDIKGDFPGYRPTTGPAALRLRSGSTSPHRASSAGARAGTSGRASTTATAATEAPSKAAASPASDASAAGGLSSRTSPVIPWDLPEYHTSDPLSPWIAGKSGGIFGRGQDIPAGRWEPPADLPERLVYRPPPQYRSPEWLGYVFERLYARAESDARVRPFVVYTDEGLAISEHGGSAKRWLSWLAVTGRSLDFGFWLATQRPSIVPVSARTEAWRWYIFHLGDAEDRKEVVRYMQTSNDLAAKRAAENYLVEATDNYGFIEMRRDPSMAGRRLFRRMPPMEKRFVDYLTGGS